MDDFPLNPRGRGTPIRVQNILNGLLALSVLLNIWLLTRGDGGGKGDEAPVENQPATTEALPPPSSSPSLTPPPLSPPQATEVTYQAGGFTGLRRLDGTLDGALASFFAERAEGKTVDWLTATTNRLLIWQVNPRTDMRKGDPITVLYEPQSDGKEGEVRIAALKLQSQKLGREVRAYYFTRPGSRFGTWYDSSGVSIPKRLKEPVIREYEEITSLLKDGRGHKGVDFTAPVGTEVVAPKAGTITRVNWNWKANGNCVEMQFPGGVFAKFLHLDRIQPGIEAGKKVAAGTVLAASGNTGRSNGPHLHYQLNRGAEGAVVDPLEYHGAVQDTLSGTDIPAFRAVQAQFDLAFEGKQAPPVSSSPTPPSRG